MATTTWPVDVGGEGTEALWDPPAGGDRSRVFICAHGAGGHANDRLTVAAAAALRERGLGTVRFNFLYRAKRSARPDAMPRLLECFEAVIAKTRRELDPQVLVIGGRSMGGRAASMLISEKPAADGLLLLAYPLHPPGQPQKMRDAHLPAIKVFVLCINGTRDPFCEPALMKQVLARLGSNWRMLWLEGADHSFHVLKSSGRTDRQVLEEVAAEVQQWVTALE